MNSGLQRTRWAAIGAALAIAVGAGGLGISHATTSSGPRSIFIPIAPCRLVDTRPGADTVGPRSSPLGPSETYTVSGQGTVGNCALPAGTSGLSMNVTAVDPSAPTFLTVFPAGAAQPLTSNLNPTPGQPPTPNSVTVGLSPSGEFSIFNRFGSVHVIIDVVGVYDDHNHHDLYYTKAEVDALLATATRAVAVTVGNGEGVGGTICSPGGGIELFTRTADGTLRDARFAFVVPDYAHGQIRANGSLRTSTPNVIAVEHPAEGSYCIKFSNPQPSQVQAEAAVASIHGDD